MFASERLTVVVNYSFISDFCLCLVNSLFFSGHTVNDISEIVRWLTASLDDVPRDDLNKMEVKEEIDEENRLQ